MKKVLLFCAIMLLAGIVALPFVLEQQIEQTVRDIAQANETSATSVRCSFWQRTVTLEKVRFTQHTPQGSMDYQLDRVDAVLPSSLFINLPLLWAGQEIAEYVPVAEAIYLHKLQGKHAQVVFTATGGRATALAIDGKVLAQAMQGASIKPQELGQHVTFAAFSLQNLRLDTPDGKLALTLGSYSLENWDGSVLDLCRLEQGAIIQADSPFSQFNSLELRKFKAPWQELYGVSTLPEQLWKQITFSTFSLKGFQLKIPGNQDTVTLGAFALEDWDGTTLGHCRLEQLAALHAETPVFSLASLQLHGLKVPPQELYARALRLSSKTPNEEILAFLWDFFLQPKPFINNITLAGLKVDESLLPLAIDTIALDWQSTWPWDSSLQIRNVSLPVSSMPRDVRQWLPGLKMFSGSADLHVQELSKGLFREQWSLSMPNLLEHSGDIIQLWTGDKLPASEADCIRHLTLNDAHLRLTDQGMLAYAMGNLANGQAAQVPALTQAIAEDFRKQFAGKNLDVLLNDILKFAQYPGTIDFTLRKKPLGIMEMVFAGALDPTALVQTTITPGKVSLQEQVKKLFAQPAKK